MKSMIRHLIATAALSGLMMTSAHALSLAPPEALEDRVKAAEMIFVGTLIERVEEGEWVRAVLRVDEALHGLGEQKRVDVIWRKTVGEWTIYDAEEGRRGIAILGDKHEERYWLRGDKFEPLEKLDEVRELVAELPVKKIPTFEEWVEAGKPLPEGMMFIGGTPWFDEAAGRERTAEEVYEIVHGQPARPAPERPAEVRPSRFPEHWGEPPAVQTRDLRPLPGGYGRGSGTLARWIEENMERDARKEDLEGTN